jgi:hypothetical protein
MTFRDCAFYRKSDILHGALAQNHNSVVAKFQNALHVKCFGLFFPRWHLIAFHSQLKILEDSMMVSCGSPVGKTAHQNMKWRLPSKQSTRL